ncbi:MAG: GFA family protein [Pseudomonadales bacterium]|nr:GFA family protein [Pseudomonadales bacterium]
MEGKCLCGAVSIQAKENTVVEACHCGMCRRWGGGPFIAIHCGSDVKISGSDNITEFDSSAWASRAFCKNCGTHLFYRFKPANEYIVPVGLFQDQDGFEFKEQIFIDKKPSYYDFANKTQNLTEAQVFQKYAPK